MKIRRIIALALLAFSALNHLPAIAFVRVGLVAIALAAAGQLSTVFAQGAFTYQGRLNNNGLPANGSFDLRFILHGDANLPGFEVGQPRTNNAVSVTNGLFTTLVDFGPVWDNQPRWLELGVRPAGSLNDFALLTPRQPVTVTPRADYANRAAGLTSRLPEDFLPTPVVRDYVDDTISGLFTFAPFSGNSPFLVNSSVQVTNLNADLLDGLDSSAFWKLSGNSATTPGVNFLGTTDNQPLELKVNGMCALRLEPSFEQRFFSGSPNVIGGSSQNFVAAGVVGATIGGGGADLYFNTRYTNSVTGDFGTVGGGLKNSSGHLAAVGGGIENTSSGYYATVGGGFYNRATNNWATVPGGDNNLAGGQYSFAAGRQAQALHDGSFVWADSQNAYFNSTANNQFLIRASGGVGIGTAAPGMALQVGDAAILGSQGMIRLSSRTPTGNNVTRTWDVGVPQTGDDASGTGYSFVIKDALQGSATNTTPEFVIKYVTGYVGLGTNVPSEKLHVIGNIRASGTVTATTFNPPSDRNLKENFAPVSPREVLDKVAAMPISRWNFIGDAATPHVGPMAQDFYAAFGVGADDKHIATVDADGVALAAIQGLNEKVEVRSERAEVRTRELEQRLEQKETEITELKLQMQRLEQLIHSTSKGTK